MKKIPWFLLALFWFITDQITKYYAVVALKDKQRVIDILPILRLRYAENNGAAFSILAGQKWFFLAIGAVATVVLIKLILEIKDSCFLLPFAYASILGGAVGNVYDRATLSYVRDMISVYYEPIGFHFAIFNIADVAISVGVFALFIDWLLSINKEKK